MLKPLKKNIVIQVEETEEVSSGGIVLPSSAKEKEKFGKVIAVGTDIDKDDVVKEGDTVLFKPYAGSEVKVNDEEYLVVEIKDVLAIIE